MENIIIVDKIFHFTKQTNLEICVLFLCDQSLVDIILAFRIVSIQLTASLSHHQSPAEKLTVLIEHF